MNNFAHLKPSCPFYPFFPNGFVPIVNIIVPNLAVCEGTADNKPQEVYLVDLDRLTSDQWDKVSALVHSQCDPHTPLEVARKEIKARGLPLRAIHVDSVSSDAPFFL